MKQKCEYYNKAIDRFCHCPRCDLKYRCKDGIVTIEGKEFKELEL
jgi:hypothetical protein